MRRGKKRARVDLSLDDFDYEESAAKLRKTGAHSDENGAPAQLNGFSFAGASLRPILRVPLDATSAV